jgi:penicillin-binding protein 1C
VLFRSLERLLTKDQILEEYLNRAPYGGNCIGAEAAALRTFGKPARDLSPAEAAMLAGLPQGPARLDPLRFKERALRRQRWILDEMLRAGKIDQAARRRATEEALSVEPRAIPFEAPEFVEWLARCGRTTLDLDLQHEVEGFVRAGRSRLAAAGAGEAAVVVLDNATGEVLAFVGPAAARRSPGSALKPFVYALAIESGRTPATIYDDAPARFDTPGGEYAPRNYDGVFHGPVTMRQPLANSLNVPAVLALREAGVGRFIRLLREIGLDGVEPNPQGQGLGLILGDCRVSPVELAGAYSMLARGGEFIKPHGSTERPTSARVLPPQTCYLIADILSDDNARALSFGTDTELAFDLRVAAKTGTSVDHRDNWVAGFTARHTVVVWVGNADGRPLRGTSGLEGAGPIFRAVMQRMCGEWVTRPEGIEQTEVCAESGLRPTAGCGRTIREWFVAGRAPKEACAPRERTFRVDSPRPSALFALDPESPGSTRFISFSATAPEGASVEWILDGAPLAVTRGEHSVRWPARVGSFELRVRCEGKDAVRRFTIR